MLRNRDTQVKSQAGMQSQRALVHPRQTGSSFQQNGFSRLHDVAELVTPVLLNSVFREIAKARFTKASRLEAQWRRCTHPRRYSHHQIISSTDSGASLLGHPLDGSPLGVVPTGRGVHQNPELYENIRCRRRTWSRSRVGRVALCGKRCSRCNLLGMKLDADLL